jgi:threonyl-tRNA synthetase
MIHRVVFGSIERFIGILTEHFAGAFPLWLAPVQLTVLPISEKQADYAQSVYERLKAAGFRVELDDRNEKIGYRIRESQLQKVPYMLVLGDKEVGEGTVSVRDRAEGDKGQMSLESLIDQLKDEVARKVIKL